MERSFSICSNKEMKNIYSKSTHSLFFHEFMIIFSSKSLKNVFYINFLGINKQIDNDISLLYPFYYFFFGQ